MTLQSKLRTISLQHNCCPPHLPHREAYRGALTEEELDALDRAAAEKERAMLVVMERETELRKLREGQLTSSKVGRGFKTQHNIYYGESPAAARPSCHPTVMNVCLFYCSGLLH